MASAKSPTNTLLTIVILILVIAGAYYFFNGRDTRSGGEKIGDAVDSFSETGSLKNAGNQLKDSTPADKLGNAISDKTK